MSTSDPDLRRVCIHAGPAAVDLVLPAAVPVATLIPSIVDVLEGAHGCDDPKRYQLSGLGASPFDRSTTLAQNDIRDGAVLVLSQSSTPPPAPRYDDVAEAVSATLDAPARPWSTPAYRVAGAVAASCLTCIGVLALTRNTFSTDAARHPGTGGVAALAGVAAVLGAAVAHRAYRDPIAGLALGVIAIGFAAAAGFLAVPGAPGIANVLLAAMAAAVTSVMVMRAAGCAVVPLTAVSCVAMIIAVAALVGLMTAAPLQCIGSVSALTSLGLLGLAARVSIALAGLSPRLPPAVDAIESDVSAKAIRADAWLTSLLAAFASAAAIGAIVTVLAGAPRLPCIAFAGITGAVLVLRARCIDGRRTLVFVTSGIVTLATTFGVAAISAPNHGTWVVAATTIVAAAAMYLGFVAPALTLSPVARRGVELLEWLALLAMAPLTCWICGVYGAVRGLNLR